MVTADSTDSPRAPATLEEAGLTQDLVVQLALKMLYFTGELTGAALGARLGLAFAVIEPAMDLLKAQHHVEIAGGAIVGGSSYRFRITNEGRGVAGLYLRQNQYVGFAPVPLLQYQKYMDDRRTSIRFGVTRAQVHAGFNHLVLSERVLDEIGPALNNGQSLFIYGPPGNGKTMIARALRDLLSGTIEIPHAIEVEGSIIRIFDPVSHETVAEPEATEAMVKEGAQRDRRWVTCRRPMVAVGGELSLESLDLSYEPRLGYYRAPLHMIANGGMLLIDDFGRQRCSPGDLLNRWMVPLESGSDYLMLQSGLTFEVPFHAFVTFSTNIKPSELVDEAFLRRVRYKVLAENPSEEQFIQIFANYCAQRGVAFDRALVEQLLGGFYRQHHVEKRSCQPRDLVNQALVLAQYREQPRALTLELLEAACRAYFVTELE